LGRRQGFRSPAPITAIHPASVVGHFKRGAIWFRVNGETRQHADLSEMIWNVSEIIAELSTYIRSLPATWIFTGTPAGVGALQRGDEIVGGIDGLSELRTRIV
jgi:fumarylpyruvate hydrolase